MSATTQPHGQHTCVCLGFGRELVFFLHRGHKYRHFQLLHEYELKPTLTPFKVVSIMSLSTSKLFVSYCVVP